MRLFRDFQNERRETIIARLRKEINWIPVNLQDDEIYKIYTLSISLFQTKQTTEGNSMEDIISAYLHTHEITHYRQVPIDRLGCISSKKEFISLVDFVITDRLDIGTHISSYIVLSSKKSCRERWLQDEWTFTNRPKKYILFTLSNDYPNPIKFGECPNRVIITTIPKRKDTRIFKLSPDDLLCYIKNENNG
jgi:hypothetical protein